jgi:hypothetical protein
MRRAPKVLPFKENMKEKHDAERMTAMERIGSSWD